MSAAPPAIPATPANAQQLWEATLGQLLLRVTRQNYDTWLRYTVGMRFDGTTLVVAAANDLACDWLSTRMRAVVAQAVTAVAGPGLSVRFEPTEPIYSGAGPVALQPSLLPESLQPLNPRFSFDSFLEGGYNRLALTASRSMLNEDACYSPLFITGGSGTGKTHLLHSIAHEARRQEVRFLLVAAEQFLSEFTHAIRARTGAAFRARYRDLDLLLVDDVHILLGKKATLNEFYQTLACLHDQGKRVVVAGDPSAMTGDAARFQGPLRWGLAASIEPPSTEDRVRFVEAKASAQGMDLPEEIKHYLALRVRTSMRDLEGAVNRLTAQIRISLEPLTIEFTARALQPATVMTAEERPLIQPSELLAAVCRHFGLSPEELAGQKRDRVLTYARHVAMYLLRRDAGMTFAAIARLLGKKDHSTVVHACSQLEHELRVSTSLRADLDAIRAALRIPIADSHQYHRDHHNN